MTAADIPLLLLLVVALVAAVVLAAAEASLLRVSEIRARSLAETDDPRALRLRSLLGRIPEVLNLILLLALMAQIGSAAITGFLAQRWFGSVGVTVASIVLTLVLFVYGEAIPKTYAIRHAEETALRLSGFMTALERLFRPIVSLLVWVADVQLPGKGIETAPTITESELRLLAGRAAYEGEITPQDQALIERAFTFGDRLADDVMIPRPDVTALEEATPLDEAVAIALRAGHRRLPVYRESLENIIGVVKLRDMIEATDAAIVDLMRPPLLVPESKRITELLEDMQSTRTHLAIVVDEYGITSGLVTVEDIAEELLGSISEDPDAADFVEIGTGVWRLDGSVPVEDLEKVGMTVPDGDWNTVAGLMVGLAGRLLKRGESVESSGFRFTVATARRHRITRVTVEQLADEV